MIAPVHVDLTRLSQADVARYRLAATPEQQTARRVLDRMHGEPNRRMDDLIEKLGTRKARAEEIRLIDEPNSGTELIRAPYLIAHHARKAQGALDGWCDTNRCCGWKGIQAATVRNMLLELPVYLRDRLTAVFETFARDVDPDRVFERVYDQWEREFLTAVAEVDRKAKQTKDDYDLSHGMVRRLRKTQIDDYMAILDDHRGALLPWFDSLREVVCSNGEAHEHPPMIDRPTSQES